MLVHQRVSGPPDFQNKPSKTIQQVPARPSPPYPGLYPYPPGKASIIRTAPCGCSLVICTLKNLGVEKLAHHPLEIDRGCNGKIIYQWGIVNVHVWLLEGIFHGLKVPLRGKPYSRSWWKLKPSRVPPTSMGTAVSCAQTGRASKSHFTGTAAPCPGTNRSSFFQHVWSNTEVMKWFVVPTTVFSLFRHHNARF